MNQIEYQYIFKITLIGKEGVGKSSMLMRFAEDIFADAFLPTIGVDFKIKALVSEGSQVRLQMWRSGDMQNSQLQMLKYLNNTNGILFVFDITNRQSFEAIKSWLSTVHEFKQTQPVKLLIGNKCDLQHEVQVSRQQAYHFACGMDMKYFETSSKNGHNIEEVFVESVVQMKQKFRHTRKQTNKSIALRKENKEKITTCW